MIHKIIHIDMDAFYASVELKKRPELQHLPVVVAFDRPRSVICAASYPARQFGLRSAMPLSQAKKLCPQLITIAPNFDEYRQISQNIHQIFQRYTDKIEPIALDEAYLDVTQNKLGIATATEVAQAIRHDIWQQLSLTASAGVAPNKFLAKIASDWQKPNGLFVIKPHQVQQFILPLALKKIPGVGKVTQQKLADLGFHTLGDLQQVDENFLIQHFGKYGKQLFLFAQGIDERPVISERNYQQISKEITFNQDLNLSQAQHYWQNLAQQIWHSLLKKQCVAFGLNVKLKCTNFQIMQHSQSFKQPFHSVNDILIACQQLLYELHIADDMQFRLIGLGVYHLEKNYQPAQLNLW